MLHPLKAGRKAITSGLPVDTIAAARSIECACELPAATIPTAACAAARG